MEKNTNHVGFDSRTSKDNDFQNENCAFSSRLADMKKKSQSRKHKQKSYFWHQFNYYDTFSSQSPYIKMSETKKEQNKLS